MYYLLGVFVAVGMLVMSLASAVPLPMGISLPELAGLDVLPDFLPVFERCCGA